MATFIQYLRKPISYVTKLVLYGVLLSLLAVLTAEVFGAVAYGPDRYAEPHCYSSNWGAVCCYAPGCPGIDD
jgi:hypothetical protein